MMMHHFLVIPDNPTPLLVPEDGGEFNYDLTFSKALVQPIKVWIETTNGTAIKDTDFIASATHERTDITTDTLPVPFTARDNTETGANKTFTFRITQMEGARFPEGVTSLTGTVTIVDDESTTLTLSNTEFFVEEDVAGENFDLNIGLSSASEVDVSFLFFLTNGNALKDNLQGNSMYADYRDPVGIDSGDRITIPAGETTKTISIPIVDDDHVEGNHHFSISLRDLIGAKFTDNESRISQNIVIFDDDSPVVSISADTYSIAEDGGQFTFKVSVADYKSGIVRYRVFTESETGDEFATVDSDYSSFSVGGEFGRNTQEREHTITILDDLLKEGEETFKISLEIEDSYQGRLPKGSLTHSKTVTIYDDESTTLSVKNTRFSIDENVPSPHDEFVVDLELSRIIDVDATVEYDLENITATKPADYIEEEVANRKATIIAGETRVSFPIEIENDSLNEGNQTFKVVLKNPVASVFESGDTLEKTITIVDDEYPTIELPDTLSIAEDVAEDEIQVSVTLSGPSSRSIAVNYTTASDTAIMGEDFTFTQSVLNFAPGVTEQTLSIPILDDTDNEGNESFNIQFTGSIGAAVFEDGETSFTKSVTIVDNESPTLSILNTEFNVYEDSASGKYELELELSGARSTGDVSLNFAVNGGTATNLIDFTNSSETITIAPGNTNYTVDIGIIDDAIIEGNKTIRFNLSNLSGAVFAGGVSSITRTVTIVEDDSTIFSLTTTNFEFNENLTGGDFEVAYQISKVRAFDVSFAVTTGDDNDTATKVLDYTAIEDRIFTIEAGQRTGTFLISINNDLLHEGVERFSLKIENVVGATIAENVNAIEKTLIIVDDEIPTLAFDTILTSGRINEGYGQYDFQFNISPVVAERFTISAQITDGTARIGHDYIMQTGGGVGGGSVAKTIESSSTSLTLPGFEILEGSTADGNKTFSITLRVTQNNGVNVAVFPNGSATQTISMTIVDDESLTVSIDNTQNIRVDEDAGEVVVGYSIPTSIPRDITFLYNLINLTADKNSDYSEPESAERNITISAGTTSGSFSIPILNDALAEGEETFNINFSDLTNAVFAGGGISHTEIVKINENDLPTISIPASEFAIAEDGGSLVVNLALSHASYKDVSYGIELVDGTAVAPVHFSTAITKPDIPTGSITGSFTIPIINNEAESIPDLRTNTLRQRDNLGFSFRLVNPSGAILPPEEIYAPQFPAILRFVTILDDEMPNIEIIDPTNSDFVVAENVSERKIRIDYKLNKSVTWDVVFDFNMSGGTAIKNADYGEISNRRITIRAGATTGFFEIPIINDSRNEGDETFIVTFTRPIYSGASSFKGGGLEFKQTVTIEDDEVPELSLSNRDLTVSEAAGAAGFVANFSLSGATDSIVSFDYELTGGTAIEGH